MPSGAVGDLPSGDELGAGRSRCCATTGRWGARSPPSCSSRRWVATWRPQVDPDAWWHLAIGDSFIATGGIPATEPFSWLTAGEPFVAHSWLWDVVPRRGMAGGRRDRDEPPGPAGHRARRLAGVAARSGSRRPAVPPLGRARLVLAAVVARPADLGAAGPDLDVAFVLAIGAGADTLPASRRAPRPRRAAADRTSCGRTCTGVRSSRSAGVRRDRGRCRAARRPVGSLAAAAGRAAPAGRSWRHRERCS